MVSGQGHDGGSRIITETGTTMKFRTAIRACAALLGIAAMAMTGSAFGQSVENFYHGKTLTLVVSADAGTPTDIIARQFARFFVNYIPGKPRAVVMNVVGAGGMVAAASLQSRQPND